MATKNETIQIELTKQEVALMKESNEREHSAIIVELKTLSKKIDDAMFCKADKSDVDSLKSKLWGVTGAVITAFIGLVFYVIQSNLK